MTTLERDWVPPIRLTYEPPTPAQISHAQGLLSSRVLNLSDPLVVRGLRGEWGRMGRSDVAGLIGRLKRARKNDV